MSCNSMAVAVLTVPNEHLTKLLSGNKETVMAKFKEYYEMQYPGNVMMEESWRGFRIKIGPDILSIRDGKIMSSDFDKTDKEFQEAFTFLNVVADSLFADEVAEILATGGTITDRVVADVEYKGEHLLATIISLNVGYLKARVFVMPGGQLQTFVDNGSQQEAFDLINAMGETLQAAGVDAKISGKIESHRNQPQHVHIMNKQTHAH